jgi:hypothetical protein
MNTNPGLTQTSMFRAYSALLSMNARLGSTLSPISVVKISSAAIAVVGHGPTPPHRIRTVHGSSSPIHT